ncbi:MAG: TonB-dependent receptor [Acidobacteria bacterium]|nr:TonB-dependent receptor [Acidobacteriota bacterium]
MYRLIATCLVGTVAAAALAGTTASAQEAGAVRGTVTLEENGEPVHGAVILVVGSGAFALTDEQGMFEIDNIPAGSYEVLAQREHLTAGRQSVIVDPGETAMVDFMLGLSPVHEDVTVTASVGGTETTFEAFNAVTTMDSFDITRESAGSLGDALRNEPGIASRSFGPGSSRPIIRGFDGDRVLILDDGLRTGDLSSQSGDHGVTIDPNGAERIEIVRGPATLLYGSNAVGGLVNIITPHESYRESLFEGARAQFGTNVGSANAEAGTTASLQYSQNNVLVWGGGSMRRTDDYATPEGPVENSASELTNARAGLGWFGDRAFASGGLTLEDGRYGVPFADEFHQAHGVHAGEGPRETAIDLASRRRVGRFDMGLRNLANTFIEGVRVALSVIDWKHDELEIEDGVERIGTRFTNRTYIMRADVDQRQTERLSGRFGAWAQLRDFEAVGVEALAPRTDQTSFAAFAYEEVDFQRTRLQFGGRVEQNDYRTAGRMVPDAPGDDHGHSHGLEVPGAPDRQFLGASASVGLHTDVGAGSAFVANLTHSHRAPALEELYNFGPHVGNLAFEIGNPTLDAETTLGVDVSFRHQAGRVRSNLNAYVYSIDNFIFGDRTGEVEDNLPVWYFIQGDSRFVGFDAKSSVRLGGNAWATLGIGYVDADLTTTGEPLPRIPPLRGTVSLDVPYGGFTFSPQLEFAGQQANVFRDETATNGYSIVNLRASYVWPRQHTAHILSFTGYNLTNELYRNHTSFIKDLAPEMGRGVRVNYSVRFF